MKVSILLSLYKCEKYLDHYFKSALNQKGIEKIEFSIVHNTPTPLEKKIIDSYKNKVNIIYQEVDREPLYKSWNRAIKQSTGEYLACWNVDDLREKDSIERMVNTLDNNPDIGFTYGDIIIVNEFGKNKGEYIKTPEYNFHRGTTGAIGGPFFMWRRNLITKIGYFDEQFRSGGDFDYTVRLSIFSEGRKTQGLIGYFLNEKSGLSTKNNSLQIIEREVIQLRYGIWYKVNFFLKRKISAYQIKSVKEFDEFRGLEEEINSLVENRKKWKKLILLSSIKNQIIHILRIIKRVLFTLI